MEHAGLYPKINFLLKKKGYLVIFWSITPRRENRFRKETRKLFSQTCKNYPNDYGFVLKDRINKNAKKSGLFKRAFIKKYVIKERYSRREFVDLVSTYSWVSSLKGRNRKTFFEGLDALLKRYGMFLMIPREYHLVILQRD